MSDIVAQNPALESDYGAIELAVMETERGRWFLNEYARRNRHADTEILLTALSRIEKSVSIHREPDGFDKIRLDILEMSKAIARTRSEISAIRPDETGGGRIFEASGELDSIVSVTEKATSDILAAAENVQETAWALREANADPATCDLLDERAIEIYTACSFQDLTSQRIRKVIGALAFLEQRVNAMVSIWQFTEHAGEASAASYTATDAQTVHSAMSQADVDYVLVESESRGPEFELDVASAENAIARSEEEPVDSVGNVSATALAEVAQLAASTIDEAASTEPFLNETEVLQDKFPDQRATHESQISQAEDFGSFTESSDRILPDTSASQLAQQADAADAAERTDIDELLFTAPQVAALNDRAAEMGSERLHLIHSQQDVNSAIQKVRTGADLSADEASKALDALKNMSVADRTRLFS